MTNRLSPRAADRILRLALATCHIKRLLHVECGDGLLVRSLLSLGFGVEGCDDSAETIAAASSWAPGCFKVGDVRGLPWANAAFETVICTSDLASLSPPDRRSAARELRRVTRHHLLLSMPATDRIDDRVECERLFIENGFRKHPLGLRHGLRYGGSHPVPERDTFLFEVVSDDGLVADSLQSLLVERDLHMDMSREAGRRSDAHLERYDYASRFIRPGDVVLDAACGLGYGAAVMFANGRAGSVIGLDVSDSAVSYANRQFATPDGAVRFERADFEIPLPLPDASVDLVACFETLEHIRNPEAFLEEVDRVLRPGGRIVASVPNDWTDETGEDPNPHHLQVYDWPKLKSQIARRFIVDAAASQIAGGGMKLTDQLPRWLNVAVDPDADVDAEWWLMVGLKKPQVRCDIPFLLNEFPAAEGRVPSLISFAEDYENPWLLRTLLIPGWRTSDVGALSAHAQDVLARSGEAAADKGAALCVLAYRMLERTPPPAPDELDGMVEKIEAFIVAQSASQLVHVQRWRVSLSYVEGRLLSAAGRGAEAEHAFRQCVSLGRGHAFALLATKTVDACLRIGLIRRSHGAASEAHEWFQQGMREALDALKAEPAHIVGSVEAPLLFGFVETREVLAQAKRCAELYLDDVHPQSNGSFYGLGGFRIDEDPNITIADQLEAIVERDQKLITARDDMTRLIDAVQDRDQRLTAGSDEIRRLWREVEERERRLVAMDSDVRRLGDAVKQRDDEIRRLWGEIEQREHRLAAAGGDLQRLGREIEERDRRLRDLNDRVQSLEPLPGATNKSGTNA